MPDNFQDEKLKEFIKKNLKASLEIKFNTPRDLDDFLSRREFISKRVEYYDARIKELEKRLQRPVSQAFTKKSWEIFCDLTARIHREKLFHIYHFKLYCVARKIFVKDFLADHSEGTYH